MARQRTGAGYVIDVDQGGAGGGLRAVLANFDIDDDALKPEHKAYLDARVMPLLNAGGAKGLAASGKAGSSGPEAANAALPALRAQAVLDYVNAKGIGATRLWIADRARVGGDDAGARAVEVQVVSTYDPAADAELRRLNALSIGDVLAELSRQPPERLRVLRLGVRQAKGIDNGRMLVALDAVWYHASLGAEGKPIVLAEARALLKAGHDRHAVERYMSKAAHAHRLPAGVHKNARQDEPHPDPRAPRITGRYESTAFDLTVQINQAGTHIECFAAPVLKAGERQVERVPHRLLVRWAGDLQADGTFALYGYPDPKNPAVARGPIVDPSAEGPLAFPDPKLVLGTLRVVGDGTLDMLLEGNRFLLRRLGLAATLSERAMRRLPKGSEIVRAREWFPLTSNRIQALRDRLTVAHLSKLLQAFFEADNSIRMADQFTRYQHAVKIDEYIGKVFSTNPPDGMHADDLLLARFYGRRMLAAQRWTYDESDRSLLDWIEVVVDTVASFQAAVGAKPLEHLRDDLGLRADKDGGDGSAPQQHYEVDFTARGISGGLLLISGSAFSVEMTIKKTTPPTWTATFSGLLGGVALGPGAGVGLGWRTSGSADTYSQWLPSDVPGWFDILDLSGSGSAGLGAGYGGTLLSIQGKGIHPAMNVDLSGVTMTVGVSIGVSLGNSWGYTYDDDVYRKMKVDHVIPGDSEHTVSAHLDGNVHFLLGDARLTPEGRQALRVFCATELAALQSPTGKLAAMGHTDRIDTTVFNQMLSENRASNVLLAIKDILGPDLGVQAQASLGFGETGAIMALEKDESPDPAWRRVDVVLDAEPVISLHGE